MIKISTPRALTGFRSLFHKPGALSSALLTIPSAEAAEILGWSGVDYIVIDAEHGAFTLESLYICVQAIELTPAACVIRVAGQDEILIKQALDLGCDGVQVPAISTEEEAQRVVWAARYPPEGGRGVGIGRASGHGRDLSSYFDSANQNIAVLVMLETEQGLENVDQIAQIKGIDGIVIGPADMSASMGLGLDPGHPRMIEAYEHVTSIGKKHHVKVGVGGPLTEAGSWHKKGADLFLVTSDSASLAEAASRAVNTLNTVTEKV